MNREILFRGKRIDNGEWVEGFYFELCYDGINTPCIGIEPLSANDYGEIFDSCYEMVDPSTVGQYTGLTDKNGKKIFAGDIVKQTNFYDNLKVQGPVVYGKAAQYIVRHTYTKQENPYKEGKTKAFAVSPRCEVIGSVHDSPELIGGEDDG